MELRDNLCHIGLLGCTNAVGMIRVLKSCCVHVRVISLLAGCTSFMGDRLLDKDGRDRLDMLLIMQMLTENGGQVDRCDFAQRMIRWMHSEFPELNDNGMFAYSKFKSVNDYHCAFINIKYLQQYLQKLY